MVGSMARGKKQMTAILDAAAADPWQIIADLQSKLDKRTAERDEALAQQTATAEVLQVINSSPGDLAPVFDAILEKAHSLCSAPCGSNSSPASNSALWRCAVCRSPLRPCCARVIAPI